MSIARDEQALKEQSNSCPVKHDSLSQQKTSRGEVGSSLPIERDEQGVWQVYGFEEARAILRSSATKQAGFNAEHIEKIPGIKNRPILYLEGKEHQQQRKQTARFFTPKTVSTSYRQFMETLADQLVDELQRKKRVDLSQLSLRLAVQVAAQVVGVTNSRLPGMEKRLNAFFQQQHSPSRLIAPLLKWKPFAKLYRIYRQRHMLTFYWLDVEPAIRARRRQAKEDVISHLLSHNYSNAEILTECVTYAAAGMVTTREFISIAAWHFLERPELRERYLGAPEEERLEMLHETLRLEPVVGHLYRRATADIALESQGRQVIISEGDLINIHIYAANADEKVVGEEPLALCPGRPIHGDRIPSMLMGFGDGHHRCPGAYIAIQETDIFLQRLLALKTLHIERLPDVIWNDMTTGYEIRNFRIAI
ncbi:MAG TPA: cytochrome P450 [Ktedonobacteraceae bacterium]|jgi:cytochrome P450|nr:cytochrome P450 [Ktedonobacteraceae bacterium]